AWTLEGCPRTRSRVASVSGHPRAKACSWTPLQQPGSHLFQATLGRSRPHGPRHNNRAFERCAPLNHRLRLRNIVREPPPAEPVTVAIPGPVDEEGLALDLVALDEAPVAAVLRVVAVVAHHEIGVGRHDRGLAAVGVAAVGFTAAYAGVGELRVGLGERLAVDQHLVAA